MACYAISDIHGRYDLLKDAVDTFIDLSKDQLILVGDYIDGDEHADSYKTLKYIYSLNQKYNVIVLKGNHEEWLLNWLFDYTSLNFESTSKAIAFPVSFIIWKIANNYNIKNENILLNILNNNCDKIGKKNYAVVDREKLLNKWRI